MSGQMELTKPKTKKSEALWVMTFADLSFILMCFFALQISFSKPNKQQFDNVIHGMVETPKFQAKPDHSMKELAQKIEEKIKEKKIDKTAQVKLDADGVAIEFGDNMLFRTGSAKVSRKTLKTAESIMDIIAQASTRYKVTIEGHTDDTPLRGHKLYKSNWDLSAARAISLLNYFGKKSVPSDKMRVVAYGSTKPKIDPEGLRGQMSRQARAANRRVVIRIE